MVNNNNAMPTPLLNDDVMDTLGVTADNPDHAVTNKEHTGLSSSPSRSDAPGAFAGTPVNTLMSSLGPSNSSVPQGLSMGSVTPDMLKALGDAARNTAALTNTVKNTIPGTGEEPSAPKHKQSVSPREPDHVYTPDVPDADLPEPDSEDNKPYYPALNRTVHQPVLPGSLRDRALKNIPAMDRDTPQGATQKPSGDLADDLQNARDKIGDKLKKDAADRNQKRSNMNVQSPSSPGAVDKARSNALKVLKVGGPAYSDNKMIRKGSRAIGSKLSPAVGAALNFGDKALGYDSEDTSGGMFPGSKEKGVQGNDKSQPGRKGKPKSLILIVTACSILLFAVMGAVSVGGAMMDQQKQDQQKALALAYAEQEGELNELEDIMRLQGEYDRQDQAAANAAAQQSSRSDRIESGANSLNEDLRERGGDTDSRRRATSADGEYDLYHGLDDGGGEAGVENLTKRQLENYTVAYNRAVEEGLSEKGILAVITVVTTETRGWNLANDGIENDGALPDRDVLGPDQDPVELRKSMDHPQSDGLPKDHGHGHGGDHGSVGIIQQQYPWWGTVDELMDRSTAAWKFIEKFIETDYENQSIGLTVQSVQRSFDPTGANFESSVPTAKAILEHIRENE